MHERCSTRSWRGGRVLIVATQLLCATPFPWDAIAVAEDGRPAGHQRMVALLADIARRTPEENPLLGTPALLGMRQLAEQAAERGDPSERVERLKNLAIVELSAGNTDRAVEAFAEAQALVESLPDAAQRPVRAELLFWRGVQAMREGESRNCVAQHSSASCIVPLADAGVHADKAPGRRAIARFTEALDLAPAESWVSPCARWLLNIAYMTVGEYPAGVPRAWLMPFASGGSFPRFADVAAGAGLAVRNLAGGAVADDFDGDGLLDVVISPWDPTGQLRYFRNVGDGTFADETHRAGLDGIPGGLNLVQADYDGDGNVDLLVLRGAWLRARGRWPKSLLRNDGHGRFTDVTFEAGLGEVHYPTNSAAWADYDGDGDLDLYVGNEGAEDDPTGVAYPSQLFRNDGHGRFVDVAREAGVENLRFAKGVAWGDYDGDGRPDLYVSNFAAGNRLYHNNGDGTFTDVAPALGVDGPYRSFASWFWDFDQDGALDLFVQGYPLAQGMVIVPPPLLTFVRSRLGAPDAGETPTLYKGDGHGHFRDVTHEQHLDRVTLGMGASFGDLDNDGYPDMYLGTGYPGLEGLIPNVLYHNERGTGFRDVAVAAGMAHIQKGHAVVFADLDNDGDQDVFHELGGFWPTDAFVDALFENPGFGRHWITVELRGTRSNRFGVGSRIRVDFKDGGRARSVYRIVGSAGSFGASPLRAEIGVAGATRLDRLEVAWPASGVIQHFKDVATDRFIRITEGVDRVEVLHRRAFRFRRPPPTAPAGH